MQIRDKIAIVTGAASGIGRATALHLAQQGARAIALVDQSDKCTQVAGEINSNAKTKTTHATAFIGDVCDEKFRRKVFAEMEKRGDLVRICVPAAGILRDALAVKRNRETGTADLLPIDTFRQVLEINLLHAIYWTMQMLARIIEQRTADNLPKWHAEEPIQACSVLIGSISSRGNLGQLSYACTKSALNAAAKTLNIEGSIHGVQCKIVHPGLVDTPMAAQLPSGHFDTHFKPKIPLQRLLAPEEIARAIAVLIENPAISGPLWTDGGIAPLA